MFAQVELDRICPCGCMNEPESPGPCVEPHRISSRACCMPNSKKWAMRIKIACCPLCLLHLLQPWGRNQSRWACPLASHKHVVHLKSEEKQGGAVRNDEKQEEVRTSKEKLWEARRSNEKQWQASRNEEKKWEAMRSGGSKEKEEKWGK